MGEEGEVCLCVLRRRREVGGEEWGARLNSVTSVHYN